MRGVAASEKVIAEDGVATPWEAVTGRPREGSQKHERGRLVKNEPRGGVGGKALSEGRVSRRRHARVVSWHICSGPRVCGRTTTQRLECRQFQMWKKAARME